MDSNNKLGKIIRQLRGDLSLRDFAIKCDVSHTTIDNLEKGIDPRTGKPTQVKMATLQKIADACELPVSYIINEADLSSVAPISNLSPSKQALIDWAKTVPEDKAPAVLQALQSILEVLK